MQATNLPGQKNVRRNVGQGGVVSLSTKPKQESTFKSTGRGRGSTLSRGNGAQARSGSTVGGRPVQMARDRAARNEIQLSPRKLTRTIKGELSDAAKLDMELLNTRVNPVSNVKWAVLVSCCELKIIVANNEFYDTFYTLFNREHIGKILSESGREDKENTLEMTEKDHQLICHLYQDHSDQELPEECLRTLMMTEGFLER